MKRILAILIAVVFAVSFAYVRAYADTAAASTILGKYFLIRNYSTNTFLNCSSVSTSASVRTSTYYSNHNYLWKFSDMGDGCVSIISANSTTPYCLYMDPSTYSIKMGVASTIISSYKKWNVTVTSLGVYQFTSYSYPSVKLSTISSSNNATVVGSTGVDRVYWVLEPTANNSSVLSSYEYTSPPITSYNTNRSSQYEGHRGIDIASGGVSKCLFAVESGTAVYRQNTGLHPETERLTNINLGMYVVLVTSSKDEAIYYGHLSSFANNMPSTYTPYNEGYNPNQTIEYRNVRNVAVGYTNVTRGQLLGLSGTTGESTGVHLHIEAWTDPITVPTTGQITDIVYHTDEIMSISTLDSTYKIVGGLI